MRWNSEFLVGLLSANTPAFVTAEDLDGLYGAMIQTWQEAGFIGREAGVHPVPSCPHCEEGVPYRLGDQYLCSDCHSRTDLRYLLAWPVHRDAVFVALARSLGLQGGIRSVDDHTWQLGTGMADGAAVECFYLADGSLTESTLRVLDRYLRRLILHCPTAVKGTGREGNWFPMIELIGPDGLFTPMNVMDLMGVRGTVRFDAATGSLWVGAACAGEVPVGSRECAFLECLAAHLDQYVPYQDIRRHILRVTGSRDETDAATFCHGLKRRIKKRWVPTLDQFVMTTNKSDGYRLRGHLAERSGYSNSTFEISGNRSSITACRSG